MQGPGVFLFQRNLENWQLGVRGQDLFRAAKGDALANMPTGVRG